MHHLNKQLLCVFLFTISMVFNSFGQTQKADAFYFNPVYGNQTITITPNQSSDGFIDEKLSEAIDKASKKGGGIITIKNGNYKFKEGVTIKSNVHIHVESGVNFYMNDEGVLFTAESKITGKPVTNFSIIGLDKEPFTIHFKYGNTSNYVKKNSFLKLGYTSNFKISNVKILDAFTKISSIVLAANTSSVDILTKKNSKNGRTNLIQQVFGVPSKGIIEKVHNENGSYGYGVVQMQAGNNIVYRDLSGVGGVSLRWESGLNVNQLFRPIGSAPIYHINGIELPLTIDKQPKINQVYGTNISCNNGHAAFTMSPHTVKQGSVFLSKIRTESCEAAGEVSKGFINNFKREEKAGLAVSKFQIGKGSYASNSTITDVVAVFGQYAQIKSKNFKYIPCELRVDRGTNSKNVGLSTENGLDFESRVGPSLFPFHYTAAALEVGDGGYRVQIDTATVVAHGFGSNVDTISIKGDFTCEKTADFTTEIRGAKKEKGNNKEKGKKAKKLKKGKKVKIEKQKKR